MRLIQVLDLQIQQALVFDNDDISIEAIFSLNDIRSHGEDTITSSFKYYSAMGREGERLTLLATGNVQVSMGEASTDALPARSPPAPNLLRLDANRFYSSLEQIGYDYTGPFRALSNLERKLGAATGLIANQHGSAMIAHPAMLDAAFQSVLLAQCFPEDGRLWSLHVPNSIRRISVNPHLCTIASKENILHFDSAQSDDRSFNITGDVDVYPSTSSNAMLQVEGLVCVPFTRAMANDDKRLFSTLVWDVAAPDAKQVAYPRRATSEECDLAALLERASYFFLRNLNRNVSKGDRARNDGPLRYLFGFAAHVEKLFANGQFRFSKPEWESDTLEHIVAASEQFSHSVDLELLSAVGQNFVAIVQGESTAVELGMKNDLLNRYYEEGLGLVQYTKCLAGVVKQVVHRHPHMSILEIGAGTGGATKRVLREIGGNFASYTFTDISSGLFEKARRIFGDQSERAIFKVLDISKNPKEQGFIDYSYDIVVASLVLHATPRIEETMRNVRRLLKPGGHVVILELTSTETIRPGAFFGSFPGWWLGADEGRVLSPYISLAEWDYVLRKTGFSGCDTTSSDLDPLIFPMSVLTSQAVDEQINFLRNPLASFASLFKSGQVIQDLILLGGQSLKTSKVTGELQVLLQKYCGSIKLIRCLEDVADVNMSPTTTLLSFVELDEPIFQQWTAAKFKALKKILQEADTVLWVTKGRRANNPYANMTIGLVRSVLLELSDLNFQFLDLEDWHGPDARGYAEALLRFQASTIWQKDQSFEKLHITLEPEVLFEKGIPKIPRLVPNQAMNNRYNSVRRPIFKEVSTRQQALRFENSGSSSCIRQVPRTEDTAKTEVEAFYSHPLAVKVADHQYMFLILGKDLQSNKICVSLSEENASIVHPAQDLLVPCDIQADQQPQFISLIVFNMLAIDIMKGASRGDRILVHEPDPTFAAILKKVAGSEGISTTFTTTDLGCKRSGWLVIHPQAPERIIRQTLRKPVVAFLDFSEKSKMETVTTRIATHLPSHCRHETFETLLSKDAWTTSEPSNEAILDRLGKATSRAKGDISSLGPTPFVTDVVAITNLTEYSGKLGVQSVIDWTSGITVSVKVKPIDSTLVFSDSKTY